MTSLTRRDQMQAQQIIQTVAPNLARNGTLGPNAARQMCDGFVTPQNLRQAEDAMQRARMSGDPDAFNAAQLLHQAINVQMAFQDPRSTLIENRNDKMEDYYGSSNGGFNGGMQQPGIYGNAGIYSEPTSNAERTGMVVGLGIAAAFTLMGSGRSHHHHDRHDYRNDRRHDHHHDHDRRFRR